MKRTWKQIGSLLLSVCVVMTMLPTTAFAETGTKDSGAGLGTSGEITAFAALDADIAAQTEETGTPEEELNLPTELTVTVTRTVTVTTGSAGTADVSGNDTATDSEAQKPEAQEETQKIMEEATVDVSGWTSAPAYDGDTEGHYVFTPTLALQSGITLADGITAPTITVTVAAPAPLMRLTSAGDTVEIEETDSIAAIKGAIEAALLDNNTVTVTGSKTDVTETLELNISETKTVIWQATYTGAANSLITLTGVGTLEVAGGIISNDKSGSSTISSVGNVTVSGGTVSSSAANSPAIYASGESSTVTVSGGTVTAATGTAILVDGTGSTVTVSGGTVKTTSTGNAIYADGTNSTVEVISGTVTASVSSAIYANGSNSTVEVKGGTVITANTNSSTIYGKGSNTTVTVSGGEVTGVGTSASSAVIYMSGTPSDTASVNVTVSGGKVTNTATGGYAINTAGSVEVKGTAQVSATAANTIAIQTTGADSTVMVSDTAKVIGTDTTIKATGAEATVTVSGGEVTGTGTTIKATGAEATVTVSGGEVTGAGTGSLYPVIYMSGTPDSAATVNVTVSDGEVTNTASGGYAINTRGSVEVTGGVVSATTGTAVASYSGNITVSGGLVSATTGNAVFTLGNVIVKGGVVFAYKGEISGSAGVIYMYSGTPTINDPGVVLGWDPRTTTYAANATTDIVKAPATATAYWDNSAGVGGIRYANGTNTGFLPVEGVTVTGASAPQALPVPSAPTLAWNQDDSFTLSWPAVSNATKYQVRIYKDGSQLYEDFTTSNELSGEEFQEAGSYTFSVAAIGDGVTYSNSSHSQQSVVYVYPRVSAGVTGTMDIGGQTGVSLNDGAKSGTGWAWNATTATLTLDSSYPNTEKIDIQCASSDNINLLLSGDVTIAATGWWGISVNGGLTIQAASNTLMVSSSNFDAIQAGGGIAIESGTVIATGGGNGLTTGGGSGDIAITGSASVTATGSTDPDPDPIWSFNGIQAALGDVIINTSGVVNATGGKGGISTNGGITISSGTVNVNGRSFALTGANNGVNITGGTVIVGGVGESNGDVRGDLTVNGPTVNVTVNGSITNGGSLIVSSGMVTITGTADGTRNLTGGTVRIGGVQVYPGDTGTAPTITTTLYDTVVGDSTYAVALSATGTAPITWTLESGTLPPGLNLSSGGGLSGTPATEGSYTFTLKAANTFGSDTKEFTIRVYPAGTASYSVTFDLNGGTRTGGGELTQTIVSGSSATAPTVSRSGYTFIGWDKAFANVTSNLTVTANWSYNGGGGNGGGSGGGSSSGGSSGSTPTTTTPGKTPDQPVTATTPVTATAGTNGAASAAIPEKSITDAIAKAQSDAKAQGKTAIGISVGLNVTMPKGATSLTANLTRNSLNSLVSAGVTSLELNGSPVTVSFDTKALAEIQKQSTGNISITIAPNAGLSDAAKTMIGTRPVYDLTVNYTKDGKNATVSSFGGGIATVSVPYTPAKGEAIGGLYAVYVDAQGNATRIAGSAYDANSGCVIFTTTHFSLYGIGYTAPSAKFTDVTTHWAKESIDYVVGRGLLSGTTDTTFAPDTAMTRGMLVTALGRLANVDTKAYTTNSFTDVKADSAFRPYIEWAYSKGIVQGTGNSKFEPDRAITREEIAVIFANYAKATGYTLPVTRTATTYADASSIGSTYKTAVTAMQQAGIMMGGTNNKFNPQSSATRAEVSSMLHRYIKLTIDPDTAQGWAKNDAGQYLYYKDGKALTGTQTIDGVKYFFETTGVLKTGWVQDGNNWRFYSGNVMLVGFWDLGAGGSNKTYYFDTYGNMVSGKWLQIDGKWYYFYTDGALAKSTKIDGYEVDENGVRKTK